MRTPRLVSRSSGQGVSRYSYQKAYSLGQRGSGGGPLKDAPMPKKINLGRAAKTPEPPPWNISYGNTFGSELIKK